MPRAEKQPADAAVFFLKDINPRKPNRWLALPRAHTHALADLTAGRSVSRCGTRPSRKPVDCGAINGRWLSTATSGARSATLHVHIGKLLDGVENDELRGESDDPPDIPIPADGAGILDTPVGGKLHVHSGEQRHRNVLMR